MDPYKVLGVDRNASLDDIKKAYRKLSRKYHPDANVNNPNKDQAEERFKEVQQAYQMIMDGKANESAYGSANNQYGGFGGYGDFGGFGGFGGFCGSTGNRSNTSYGNDKEASYLQAAFTYATSGDYQSALRVLQDIENRSGRWYYISAIANQGAGNQATALEHIQIAMRMEPNNTEYQQFYTVLQNGGTWYAGRGAGYGMPTVDDTGFCFKLCLANLCLNMCCAGGPCC